MSVRAGGAFAPVLRDVERGLALPMPGRIRILRELEQDLEALTDQFVASGLSQEEARSRALDALVPDSRSLSQLGELHQPLYSRLTGKVSAGRVEAMEKIALVAVTGLVLMAQGVALLQVDLLRAPSPFLLPVLGLGGVLLGMVLAKGFQFWVKGDHAHPQRGLGAILSASGLVLAMGLAGAITDFYRLAATLERVPELAGSMAPDWMVRDAALLSVAILIALAGGLAWFVLAQWVALVSGARRELLGPGNRVGPIKELNNV